MTADEPPQGQLYSHVYLDRGKPQVDSKIMRRRLAALIFSVKDLKDFAAEIPRELGVDVPFSYGPIWPDYFGNQEINVIFDTITVAVRYLGRRRAGSRNMYDPGAAANLVQEVARIFTEENVAYRIDPQGGVHPLVDPEFDANRQATIASLKGARYANVLDAVERAQRALAEIPPDGKGALRSTFAAAEGLFKADVPWRATTYRLGREKAAGAGAPAQILRSHCASSRLQVAR
jgi:hypothetical protein